MSEELDLIVIGSGPGGYVAALRAAQLGMRVAVVERDPYLGGTCLHRGCIPTKALLHTADLLDEIRRAGRFGIRVAGEAQVDLGAARHHREQVINKNARGIGYLFRKHGITTLSGWGRLKDANTVEVEGTDGTTAHRARHLLLATGSVPARLPLAPVDGERILDSDQILGLERLPPTLAVLGAGAVGCEFASIYASFGSQVTILEMLPRLLPFEDEDSSEALARAFSRRGLRLYTETRLERVESGRSELELLVSTPKGEERITADTLLVAVGRTPVTESIGLEAVGIDVEQRTVPVNKWMQTSVPSVYAIGDLVKTPMLAHLASAEGILAVEHMAGKAERPIDYDRVPWCTYCEPQVASVGLTEAEARRRGYDVAVGRFPFTASGKAAILGRTEGFVKIVAESRYDQLLGVHVVGPAATDLIAEACVALQVESTTEELFRTIHAHPTLSEAMSEAALAAAGRALHV